MNKRSVEVQYGEYYVDMSKKPQRTIWELAALNNAKRKVVAAMRAVMILFLLVCR